MLEAGDGTIKRIADEINLAQQDLGTIRTQLEANLGPMESGFKGGAGSAFQDLMMKWHGKQREINNALSDFENALLSADKVNETQDADSGASFSNIAGKMGGGPA